MDRNCLYVEKLSCQIERNVFARLKVSSSKDAHGKSCHIEAPE